MRIRGLLVLAAALLAFVGFTDVSAAPKGWHQDDRLGFKIRIPKKWKEMPLAADEKWLVARYDSKKAYFFTDKTDGWTWESKPTLKAIAFVDEVVKKQGVEKGEDSEGGTVIALHNPYKNYKDYLKRTYYGGGWYVSQEEEDEVNGVTVTQLEIKVEKLTRTGPRRIVTWIYHLEGLKLAVEFEVLEDAYDKLKGTIYKTLKSLKTVPRTQGSLAPVTTGVRKFVDESKMTLEKRTEHRRRNETTEHAKAMDSLPEGWSSKMMGRFLVLNHADDKYAKKVVAHAEAVWKWLDKSFHYIGPDEYVPSPILRICKDQDEANAYRSGFGWWGGIEIVTYKDTSQGAMSYQFESVNRRLLDFWFRHRDNELEMAMPHWLDNGLEEVIGTARAKGSRLELQPDEWERERLRETHRAGKLVAPRQLMRLNREEFYEQQEASRAGAALLRLMLSHKSKKVRAVLHKYIMNLKAIAEEMEKNKKDVKPEKAPETEEEEEERYKNRRNRWKEREAQLIEAVFERTFNDWKDKDWKRFEAEYFKSI